MPPRPPFPKPPAPRQFTPPQPGESIEVDGHHYFLGKPLGQGFFGAVYECQDEWGNELVAKVLLPKGSYEDVRDAWQGELDKLRELRHPNVTYVHDAFECRDTFYLVLERCSVDLNQLISMPGLDGSLWLKIVAREMLQALHFIHRNGYVHKDLHPGNVFLSWVHDKMVPDRDPVLQVKVGDLGISRLASDIDIFNTILADWMRPPEAILPTKFGVIDHRVDVYHAGLCFLALMVGHVPRFTPDEVLKGAPRERAEQLGHPAGPAIARALRRHVAHRTPSALDFWRELNSVL